MPDISTKDTVLAYHFGAGVGYRLTDNVILQAGYRLQAASDLEFDGRNAAGNVKVTSGLRAHFLESRRPLPVLEPIRPGWNRGGVASLDTALRAYSGMREIFGRPQPIPHPE